MLISHLARKALLLLSMSITLLGCGGGGGGGGGAEPPANPAAFSNPWTVYEFDKNTHYNNGTAVDIYQARQFDIATDGKFYYKEFNFTQGAFVEDTQNGGDNSSDFFLNSSGIWEETTATESGSDVSYNADNTVATIAGVHEIKLLSVDDISGQTLNNIIRDSSLSVTMPAGAEKTIMEHKVAYDYYQLHGEELDYSTNPFVAFTEFSQVLASRCGNNGNFDYVTNPLIQHIAFTCGQENDTSGTLVGIKQDGTLIQDIGTWKIRNLPNSTISAIITTVDATYASSDEMGNRMFAMKDGVVWEGRFTSTTESEEQTLYNQVVFDAVEAKLAVLNSDSGSDNFQVVNGELVMKSVADAPFDPATGAMTPKNVFGIIGTPQNPINSEVQAFEGDVTFVSAQTGVSATTQARGRIGMYVHIENLAGDKYYVVMMLEQRDGNPLQTRVWKDAYNSTTSTWQSDNGGTAVTALHNKPITTGTAYHFKFEKLATAGRFSIDNYTVDIPLSELPANDMKLTHLRFFNQVKYPAASGDYIEGKIDNVTVTVRTDPTTGATQAIMQNFDSYVNGTIPKPDSVINDIQEDSTL